MTAPRRLTLGVFVSFAWMLASSCGDTKQFPTLRARSEAKSFALTADFPDCRSSSSDPDGDGWGWEDNRSCRVVNRGPEVSGCDKLEFETGVRQNSLYGRSYVLSVPLDYQASKSYALVFGWHGLGLDGYQMRSFMEKMEQLSNSKAIFVYPNARNKRWDISGSDYVYFDQLVGELSRNYCIDRSKISSVGFSNGAFFANALAQNRANAIRTVVGVAGGGGGGVSMRAMIIHGNQDRWVSYGSGINSIQSWAKANNCSTAIDYSPRGQCFRLSACRSEYPTAFCPWQADHDWPRFQGADQQIWDFLDEY